MNLEIMIEIAIIFAFVAVFTADMTAGIVSALFSGIMLYFAGQNGYFLVEKTMAVYADKGIEEFYGLFIFVAVILYFGIMNIKDYYSGVSTSEGIVIVEYAPFYVLVNLLFFGNAIYYIGYLFVAGMFIYYDYEFDAVEKIAKSKRL